MSQAPRLVVVDGPDVGAEFVIPPAGGTIGRGEGSAVQLSDLAVSRAHCALEVRDGRMMLVDAGSRNRTLVNGRPIEAHPLAEGDEIAIGKTKLAFLPAEGGMAVVPTAHNALVTMEMATGDIFRAKVNLSRSGDLLRDRARRHLGALARLGDGLRRVSDRGGIGRVTCETLREALEADRAFLLLRDAAGRLAPVASAAAPTDPAGTQLSVGKELLDKVVRDGKSVIVAGAGPNGRPALAAPMMPAEGSQDVPGLIYVDRRPALAGIAPWTEPDLELAACIAHLVAAALDGIAAREALSRENRALEERLGPPAEFIGKSAAARVIMGFVAKVGPTDAGVLLLGESGAGKEMVASAIHRASRRARGPFVCVNCAALTETLLESELFGHEKGAFTGATEKKLGRFELADGGTLFLDEIGELSPKCQTKFLRVLEERRFERVGGTRSIATDVRVVAATNRNLSDMVRRGTFREDLFYRLSVIQTEVPPLRARPDDVPLLAEHFLARFRQQSGRRIAGFSPEATRALMAHPWPGNVRELKNAVERAVVLGESELVRLDDLPPQVAASTPGAYSPPTAPSAFVVPAQHQAPPPPQDPPYVATPTPAAGTNPAKSLRELEKDGIVAALAATRGNKAQAAAILEIDRSTLYKKLKEYGLE